LRFFENMNIPDPPNGSSIQTKSEYNAITLYWKKPSGGPFRYIIILFLICWLCGWSFGFVNVGGELLAGKGPIPFLVIWLAMWTMGGAFAGVVLYLLIRPQSPESVTLESNQFKYDTGSASVNIFNYHWMMRKKQNINPFSMLFQKRKTYEFTRSECPEFILEGLGDDQRLRFDIGADRITIGEYLKEPEREWLEQILNAWRTE